MDHWMRQASEFFIERSGGSEQGSNGYSSVGIDVVDVPVFRCHPFIVRERRSMLGIAQSVT